MSSYIKKNYDKFIKILNMRTFRLLIFIVSIWATIIISRIFYLFLPDFPLIIVGNHIHHYAVGAMVLIISGIALIFIDGVQRDIAIPVFGVGTGLVVDEYAFIIAGEDVGYSSKITVFTIILLSAIIIFIARYFQKFSDDNGG